MDNGAILSSSLTSVKEACRPDRWFYQVRVPFGKRGNTGTVPLFSGYLYRVMEAKPGIPDVSGIKDLFIKGWKMNIAAIIFLIVCALAFSIVLEVIMFAFGMLFCAFSSMVAIFLFIWMLVIILLAAAFGVFSTGYMARVYNNRNTP